MITTGIALSLVILQINAGSAAANDPALNLVQWLVPLGSIGFMSWMFFARGRNLAVRAGPRLGLRARMAQRTGQAAAG